MRGTLFAGCASAENGASARLTARTTASPIRRIDTSVGGWLAGSLAGGGLMILEAQFSDAGRTRTARGRRGAPSLDASADPPLPAVLRVRPACCFTLSHRRV